MIAEIAALHKKIASAFRMRAGYSMSAHAVLKAVKQLDADPDAVVSQVEIIRRTGLDRTTVCGIIKRWAEQGSVTCTGFLKQDTRVHLYTVTLAGEELLRQLNEHYRIIDETIVHAARGQVNVEVLHKLIQEAELMKW